MAEDDYRIEVYLFNPGRHLSPDCEANKQRLLADGKILLNKVIEDFTPPILSEHDVVIDLERCLRFWAQDYKFSAGLLARAGRSDDSNSTYYPIFQHGGFGPSCVQTQAPGAV